ncbi:hypothetical protein [Chengkuizengella axinellae]|uniref:Uncharacterized protein n=1 Tax=Chengkuizengella axinellae TaxID=3064388 RepID=A0ABT9J2N5_9BACL|nr:hypothetical protein [Chengkuizengella sp. 2205SS18-9]MDP5275758.1 hypothetical protein [Chengkuizengella sp. 2205SS18-9]
MIWMIIMALLIVGIWILRKDNDKLERNTPLILGSYLIIVAIILSFITLTDDSTAVEYEGKKYKSLSTLLPELPVHTSEVINFNLDYYEYSDSHYIAELFFTSKDTGRLIKLDNVIDITFELDSDMKPYVEYKEWDDEVYNVKFYLPKDYVTINGVD